MKRVLAVLFTLCAATPLLAQPKTRYLISMRRSPALSSLRLVRDIAEVTSHNVRTFTNVDFIAADLTEAEATAIRNSADVDYISPVVPRYLDTMEEPVPSHLHAPVGNGRYSKTQTVAYGIDLVHARDVWPFTRGDKSVNVAIVDTGIDYTHPDLKDRYQGGYNVFTKKDDPMDDHGHGTHVAGIIGASDNAIGVIGVAPDVRIWSAKVLQANGSGTDESVMEGIDWVISKKAQVGGNWIINLSLGASSASDAERVMFERAIDNDILVVAAAGNRGARGLDYPGAYERVVTVTAIDADSKIATFSSFGNGVAFAAPGVDVLSTFRQGFVKTAVIDTGAKVYSSTLPIAGSTLGEVTADTVFGGFGLPEDFPSDTKGKIALIKRGGPPGGNPVEFRAKARNAVNAGAVAVVIVPPVDDAARFNWTMLVDSADLNFTWPVVVSTSAKDGQALLDNVGKGPITVAYSTDDYAFLSGTSMATPHVAGVSALMWSLAPNATAEQIRLALKMTAFDLGTKSYDELFGYGRIDALAGAHYLAPADFGLPPTPALTPTRRRPSSPFPHH